MEEREVRRRGRADARSAQAGVPRRKPGPGRAGYASRDARVTGEEQEAGEGHGRG